MTYSDVLAELADRVDAMDGRRKAGLFWLLGSALLQRLEVPEAWERWTEEARTEGRRYIISGEVGHAVEDLWARAQVPTGEDSSQLLHSTLICLSTPLGLAARRCESVGGWLEHAYFPLIQQESLRLFHDVAFPDDDEDLEQVFGQPAVQRAVAFCRSALDRLEGIASGPDEDLLRSLLLQAGQVAPSGAGTTP